MIRRSLAAVLLLVLLAGCAARQRTPAPEPASVPAPAPAPEPAPVEKPPERPALKEGPAYVTLEVQAGDGTWQPVRDGATYPRTRLALRFQLHGPVDETALRQALPEGATVEQSGPDQVLAVWESPPPVLSFHGVGEPEGMVRFYTGLPPSLVAIDPATGQEQALGEVPADIQVGYLAGDRVLFQTLNGRLQAEAQLVDLKTGERWRRPFVSGLFTYLALAGDEVALASRESVEYWNPRSGQSTRVASQGQHWKALSPDGRYLAGFRYRYEDLGQNWLPPTPIILFDLKERTERVFTDVARAKVYTHGIDFYLAWSPDGRGLLLEDHPEREQVRGLRLDLDSGKVTDMAADRISPSYRQPRPGPGGWTHRQAMWEPIRLVGPGGEEKEWGEGYCLGWLPDGRLLVVRWTNALHRIVYGM